MTKRELKENIYTILVDILSGYGFKIDKKADAFKRKTKWGFHRIGFGIVDYAPEQRAGFAISIRHNQVEDICNRFLNLDKRYWSNSITLITSIDGPSEKQSGQHRYYPIRNLEDIHEMFIEVVPEIKTKGFDFFNKYSSLEEVDNKINNLDRFSRKYFSSEFAFTSLIVAKLCGRKDFEELVAYYRDEFERMPNKFLYPTNFNALVDYLRTYKGG